MKHRTDRDREEAPLRPVGVALAAVVAGLGAAKAEAAAQAPARAPVEPRDHHARVHHVDPTNHPDFERDDSLILGPSAPVEPFAEQAKPAPPRQGNLFDL